MAQAKLTATVTLSLLAIALLLLAPAHSLLAQTFNMEADHLSILSLDGPWHFHPGDDPAWASPAFDDSNWKLLQGSRSWSDQGYATLSGYAWYRFTVQLPPTNAPSSLLMAPFVCGYEVYVEGERVGGFGSIGTTLRLVVDYRFHAFPLSAPSPTPRTIHVAIRVWQYSRWIKFQPGGPGGISLAGDTKLLTERERLLQRARVLYYMDEYFAAALEVLIGLIVLCLFLLRPVAREYFWFAALLLLTAADSILTASHQTYFAISFVAKDLLDGVITALDMLALLYFFSIVLRIQDSWFRRICIAFLILSPFLSSLYIFGWTTIPLAAGLQTACYLPTLFWVLGMLTWRSLERDPDALLLLLPTLLAQGYAIAQNIAWIVWQAGLAHMPAFFQTPLHLQPFNMQIGVLLDLVFLVALLAFLLRRFALASQREERLAGDLEAARQVQQLLLPESARAVPGFTIEAVYLPAESVGGDFFQQLPDGEGGVLIVVGDVSGKGLRAAMIVSMLVGAMAAEALHTSDPAALLAVLNRSMFGQGGFATCLACRIAADGQMTIANAGHLSPYLNGIEMELPGALPLGIDIDSDYQTMATRLTASDKLTFLSDGVVEAQAASGELFGFERTRNISTWSAGEIAHTALRFGQLDDITVVKLAFLGTVVPAAV